MSKATVLPGARVSFPVFACFLRRAGVAWVPLPERDEDMPKNSSARRRRRARRIAAEEGVDKYREALRRGDERAERARYDQQAQHNSFLRPSKIEIDGAPRYVRRSDAAQLGQDTMADPAATDVMTAADILLRHLHGLQSARLRPVSMAGPDGQVQRVVQCEQRKDFLETVHALRADADRVREDADIAFVEWTTVNRSQWICSTLGELRRITNAPLSSRVDSAIVAAERLFTVCEAVHSRGCLLGAGENRYRRGWGYSPCAGGDVRVRVRIFDDDTIVTAAGCPRHAAEEIVHRDFDVEDGYVGVEVMGGTDEDLDLIYDLADDVRRERDRIRHTRDNGNPGPWEQPEPPWMRRA
ncbi:hypothetical protein [Nocardia nova]|uniref:hypothetical protein n=1 Tax=Nocardia nova TaxID=37330 RepID=UPI0033DBE90F